MLNHTFKHVLLSSNGRIQIAGAHFTVKYYLNQLPTYFDITICETMILR